MFVCRSDDDVIAKFVQAGLYCHGLSFVDSSDYIVSMMVSRIYARNTS